MKEDFVYDLLVGTSYKEAFGYMKKNKLNIENVLVIDTPAAMMGLPAEGDRIHLLASVTEELFAAVNPSVVSRGMSYERVPTVIDFFKQKKKSVVQ